MVWAASLGGTVAGVDHGRKEEGFCREETVIVSGIMEVGWWSS
jgi:hypothetical protein